ncbi:MAG: redoxin domain-containing protein, partial [Porphyromonadaceae bacterium]|nr:redoxin domain-containing protein [Porphyromonadaceae bacterium]
DADKPKEEPEQPGNDADKPKEEPEKPYIAVQMVSVDREIRSLEVGRSEQFKAVIIPNNATNQKVTWHLTNPDVATISPTGLLTGKKPGMTRLIIRSEDNGKEWTSGEIYISPFTLRVGDQYIDLVGVNTHGQPTKLSDFAGKGHYVLIDFWGRWCGVCVADIPRVRAIKSQFEKHGLVVVGVSSGDSFVTHQKAVKSLGVTWPQIVNKENPSLFGRMYGIKYYPHVVLLDRTGKIAGWNMGIIEAKNVIQSILDKEKSL